MSTNRSSIPAPIIVAMDDARRVLTRPDLAPATEYEQRGITVHGLRLRYIDVAPDAQEEDLKLLLIHGPS